MRDFVTIVSGVPRSGTSLLMQMLSAGGIEPLSDGERPADLDNPRGYFELSAVKRLRPGQPPPAWLADASGRAVKVIHALVPALPAGYAYRGLFVMRDLEEVVASQRAMLSRGGATSDELSDARWIEIWRAEIERAQQWLRGQRDARALTLHYREIVTDPLASAHRIEAFVGGSLDVAAMAAVVEPDLYRQRRAAPASSPRSRGPDVS